MKYIDPTGMDWFVNNENGNLTYIKGVEDLSKLNQDQLDKYKMGDINQYERLGADNMFGDKIMLEGSNLLDEEALYIQANGTAQTFMAHFGYEIADRVTIKETETVLMSFADEKITQYDYKSEQMGKTKVTYVKPENMDQKKIRSSELNKYRHSRTHEVVYETTRPTGVYQKPYFAGQSFGSNAGATVSVIDAAKNILKGLFGR